eukprot:360137-Chlamydomonas_euryale.AAC.9
MGHDSVSRRSLWEIQALRGPGRCDFDVRLGRREGFCKGDVLQKARGRRYKAIETVCSLDQESLNAGQNGFHPVGRAWACPCSLVGFPGSLDCADSASKATSSRGVRLSFG